MFVIPIREIANKSADMSHIFKQISNLFWHNDVCPVCGRQKDGNLLCAECPALLDGLRTCRNCACFMPVGRYTAHSCAVKGCTQAMLSCFPYMPPLKERLKQLKYYHKPQVAPPFGVVLAKRWQDFAADTVRADAIIPVPLHKSRLIERGYNQSELLANALAQRLNLPVYTDAIRRIKKTRPQHSLSPAERTENLQNAIAAGADLPKLSGKSVILLDDIITTGATAQACAAVLLQGGAAAVYALAVGGHLQK